MKATFDPQLRAVVEGAHTDPHTVLGRHSDVVRVWQPGAISVSVEGEDATRLHDAGLFEAPAPRGGGPYTYVAVRPDGSSTAPLHDPYSFVPTIGELDIHLSGEGRHRRLWDALGARPMTHEGVAGTGFSVWAPAAKAVYEVGYERAHRPDWEAIPAEAVERLLRP